MHEECSARPYEPGAVGVRATTSVAEPSNFEGTHQSAVAATGQTRVESCDVSRRSENAHASGYSGSHSDCNDGIEGHTNDDGGIWGGTSIGNTQEIASGGITTTNGTMWQGALQRD